MKLIKNTYFLIRTLYYKNIIDLYISNSVVVANFCKPSTETHTTWSNKSFL